MLVLATFSIVNVEEAGERDANAILWCIIPVQLIMPRAQPKAKDAPTIWLFLELPLSLSLFFFENNESRPSTVQVIEQWLMYWTPELLGNVDGDERPVLIGLAEFTGGWMKSDDVLMALGQLGRMPTTENSMDVELLVWSIDQSILSKLNDPAITWRIN